MPLLNASGMLFLNGPVKAVRLGDVPIWDTAAPWIDSIVPPASVSPPTTMVVEMYGSGLVAGAWVWWVPSTTPNAAAFGSGTTFRDSTNISTTLHHLNPNVTYLVWVSTGTTQTSGPLSNRVPYPVGAPPGDWAQPASGKISVEKEEDDHA
jgi:hypothetical protein